jgi:hypothetical protein
MCSSAHAEDWIRYYETGSCSETCTQTESIWDRRCTCTPGGQTTWDTGYYIDADSIRPEGDLIRYQTKIFYAQTGKSEIFEMIANCAAKMRGQLPSHDLYDTFDGTIGGEEVKAACDLARLRSKGT